MKMTVVSTHDTEARVSKRADKVKYSENHHYIWSHSFPFQGSLSYHAPCPSRIRQIWQTVNFRSLGDNASGKLSA